MVFLYSGSGDKEEAEELAERWENTSPVYVNVETHDDQLEKLIKEHDLVIRYVHFIPLQKKNGLDTTTYFMLGKVELLLHSR